MQEATNGPENPELSVTVETITRDIAGEYLTHIGGPQRPMSTPHLNDLIRKQLRGEFKTNLADAITFNVNGNLQNGRHRLEMVVATGEPIIASVARNSPLEAFFVMDDGKKRSIGDVLFINGEKESQALGEALTIIFYYLTRQSSSNRPPTKGQLLQILENHSGIRDSVSFSLSHMRTRHLHRGLVMAFHWLYRQTTESDRGDSVTTRMITGLGFQGDRDPIYALREMFNRYDADSKKELTRYQQMSLFVAAFNYDVSGKGAKFYKVPDKTGSIPTLVHFPANLYVSYPEPD